MNQINGMKTYTMLLFSFAMSLRLRHCFKASTFSRTERGSLTNDQESNESVVNNNNTTTSTMQRNQDVPDAVVRPMMPIVRHDANRHFRLFVNKSLWQVAKFLDERDRLNPNCAIANFCFDQLPHIEDRFGWWNTNWSAMQKILNSKRNSITQRFYKPFKGMSIYMLGKLVKNVFLTYNVIPELVLQGAMPTVNDFLELRGNEQAWNVLMSRFVSIVYDTAAFARDGREKLVSSFVKVLDECLALLLLENNYERWMAKVNFERGLNHKSQEQIPGPRYVEYQHEGGHRRGWRPEGYARYAALHSRVVDDRETDRAAGVERRYRNTIINNRRSTRSTRTTALLSIRVPYDI